MVIDHCSYDFITISSLNRNSDILTAILTFDQGCQKWPLLTPKKANKRAQKKRHSPNPCWHGLFAKKRVQIGQIWLLWPHLYFTPAYRGSPPCTLFQHPDNKEIGYSNVLTYAHILCYSQNICPNFLNAPHQDVCVNWPTTACDVQSSLLGWPSMQS